MAFDSLPADSAAPRGSFRERMQALRDNGFDGIQFAEPPSQNDLAACRSIGLGVAGSGRVNLPEDSTRVAEAAAADGLECMTLHVGWGIEDDATAGHLIESILEAAARFRVPLYVETHRATIFQDMWRTVQFVKRFPELRFNGDFSHWYAGQEMVYGGFEKKLAFIAPVLERVRFIHGRIANPGCIQARITDDALYVAHFRELWTRCFRAFLKSGEGDAITFAPELLAPDIYYAQIFQGKEETDRWTESLQLNRIARECFACAQS